MALQQTLEQLIQILYSPKALNTSKTHPSMLFQPCSGTFPIHLYYNSPEVLPVLGFGCIGQ